MNHRRKYRSSNYNSSRTKNIYNIYRNTKSLRPCIRLKVLEFDNKNMIQKRKKINKLLLYQN